jgi:hypothetical protein
MELPDDSKILLAEKLVAHLEATMPPELRREHLEVVNRRREEICSGQVKLVDGSEALEKARRLLRK